MSTTDTATTLLALNKQEVQLLVEALGIFTDVTDDKSIEPLFNEAGLSPEELNEARRQVSDNIDKLVGLTKLNMKVNMLLSVMS